MDQLPDGPTPWYLALIQGGTAVPKAVAKLINTIGDQIGLFFEPTHIRRKGQAEADVLVSEAKAKAEVAVIKLDNKLAIQDIQDRTAERVRKREEKRQANLEAIAAKTAQELLHHDTSDTPVDEDWLAQFFSHSQDVSNEQMQALWARLLAGEVAKPGSFSLRTLALVKVMSKEDANLFTRFCSLLWQTPNGLLPIIPYLNKLQSLEGVNLNYFDIARLDSLGLIRFQGVGSLGVELNEGSSIEIRYYNKLHIIRTEIAKRFEYGPNLLTDVGAELVGIAGSIPNEEYRAWVVSTLREKFSHVEVAEAGAAS